MEDLGKKYI